MIDPYLWSAEFWEYFKKAGIVVLAIFAIVIVVDLWRDDD